STGGQGKGPNKPSSSKPTSQLSCEEQIRSIRVISVLAGLLILKVKSLIQVCVPLKSTTLTSLIIPLSAIFRTEVTSPGDGLAAMVFGTSTLVYVWQTSLAVVNE